MFIPDMKSVLALKISPLRPHHLAISTLRGLHCMDLNDHSIMTVSAVEQKITYPAIEWNTHNGLLYACKLNGEVETWQAV